MSSEPTLQREAPARRLPRPLVGLMSAVTGLAVASNYYAQPLLADIGRDLHLSTQASGLIVTVTQFGYALGLVFLLPLGDLLERRRLLVGLTVLTALGLTCVASVRVPAVLFAAACVVGAVSVAAQILVPFAATLAAPDERGKVVGTVMSGLLVGILLARTAAGYLADLGGWPTVYWVAAGLLLVAAAALRRWLPRDPQAVAIGYPALLRSVGRLVRDEPVLRARMALDAQAETLGDPAELERRVAENPKDHQARFDLAMAQNARGERMQAADNLLAIIKADRGWNDDGARTQLLQLFEAWGMTDEATLAARRRLSSLLFA